MNSKLKEIASAITSPAAVAEVMEAERLHSVFVTEMVTLWAGSSERAEIALGLFEATRVLTRRDDVMAQLRDAIAEKGGTPREESLKAVADIMMSRSKWSPKRLRTLFEGPRLYATLTALHGLTAGAKGIELKAVLKSMAEIGTTRRAHAFKGMVGEVQEAANAEWWRAQ